MFLIKGIIWEVFCVLNDEAIEEENNFTEFVGNFRRIQTSKNEFFNENVKVLEKKKENEPQNFLKEEEEESLHLNVNFNIKTLKNKTKLLNSKEKKPRLSNQLSFCFVLDSLKQIIFYQKKIISIEKYCQINRLIGIIIEKDLIQKFISNNFTKNNISVQKSNKNNYNYKYFYKKALLKSAGEEKIKVII